MKSKYKVPRKGAKNAKKTPRNRPRRGGMGLDEPAANYARLLMDPCNAPVVPPIFPGAESGYLFRTESFSTFGAGATETSGIMHWVPGYSNNTGTELVFGVGATPGASITMSSTGVTSAPGHAFLANNARGARCVAACMKVTYPGTESGRAGRVHFGLTAASMLDTGTITTVDGVAGTLQHFTRTPAETVELVWKPASGDFDFVNPAAATLSQQRDRKTGMTVAWAGIPVSTGLTFHFTAIYEWTPVPGLGVTHDALGKAKSRNSLDDVVDRIIASGFRFVRSSSAAVGYGLASGAVSAISNVFGTMPSQARVRTISYRQ